MDEGLNKHEINGLIFKELIKRGYSLEGNTRVWNIADSKLWYLKPEQAQAYLDLENSEGYKDKVDDAEPELLTVCVDEIKKLVKEGESINVIDLGCGDGKKAAKILKGLDKWVRVRYCPIDISAYMVREAITTISKTDVEEIVEFQWNISDFENLSNITPLLRAGKFNRNVILFLGYTLGNFEAHEILHEIRASMKGEDILVVIDGVGNTKWERRAEECKNDLNTDNFFRKIPLMLGIENENLEFGARFIHSRIEFYYDLKADQEIEFQGRRVRFNKGDRIIVAVSTKQNRDEFGDMMKLYFDYVNVILSKDKSTALAVCKK